MQVPINSLLRMPPAIVHGVQRLSIAEFAPAPVENLLAYPGKRPDRSFFHDSGEFWMLEEREDSLVDLFSSGRSLSANERIPVLCIGSNSNPAQIHHKFRGLSGDSLVVFLKARLFGAEPVYAGHVARYGAIPATIERAEGSKSTVLALLTPKQLQHLSQSEGSNYNLALIRDIEVMAEFVGRIKEAFAFVSKKGVLSIDSGPVPLNSYTQQDVLEVVIQRTGSFSSLGSYLGNPGVLRQALEDKIGQSGLRQRHQIRHRNCPCLVDT